MSGIGIGSIGSGFNAFNTQSTQQYASQQASGKRINSAADDAAGMAIAKKLENQSKGAQVASNNAKDMQNLLNVSDGALGSIAESLTRIRELAVQASNGIYSNSDKAIFQNEIDGLIESINDFGKGANYNGINLLDGSFTSKSATVGANGQSMDIDIKSSLSDALGITGFNVTGDKIDLKAVDGALDAVMSRMAEVGAKTNRLEYTERALENQAYNQEAARSRKEDADMAEAAMNQKKEQVTEQVGIQMQKLRMDGMGSFLKLLA